VPLVDPRPAIRPRAVATGRPASDPGCAGCGQLGTFRALRRAGFEVQGGLGCDPRVGRRWTPASGRWAAVAGGQHFARAGASQLLDAVARSGASLLIVGDIETPGRAARIAAQLEAAGATVAMVSPSDLGAMEAAVARAAEARGRAAVVALAPCVRGATGRPAVVVTGSRCNRCGACLGLACPALRDRGGEAMVVDPRVCAGCDLCTALCRSRAIGPAAPP